MINKFLYPERWSIKIDKSKKAGDNVSFELFDLDLGKEIEAFLRNRFPKVYEDLKKGI